MSKINLVGIELEGLFNTRPNFLGNFKGDSSVIIGSGSENEQDEEDICHGGCRDDCNCYNECECDYCNYCSGCDRRTSRCGCDSCFRCLDCGSRVNECQCYRHLETCNVTTCTDSNVCASCIMTINNNRRTAMNCSESFGTYTDCDRDCDCECYCECEYCDNRSNGSVGEFVSIPIRVDQIEEWITKNYPDKTNSTCGGHVHISLKSATDYMNLMEREFYEYYLKRMDAWGKKMNINKGSSFWKRLVGANYCYAKFMPTEQRDMTEHYEDPRYAQLNYCYNVDQRHTLEFRMLPCFQKKELMISGIKETVDIVESFLLGINPISNMITMRFEV